MFFSDNKYVFFICRSPNCCPLGPFLTALHGDLIFLSTTSAKQVQCRIRAVWKLEVRITFNEFLSFIRVEFNTSDNIRTFHIFIVGKLAESFAQLKRCLFQVFDAKLILSVILCNVFVIYV